MASTSIGTKGLSSLTLILIGILIIFLVYYTSKPAVRQGCGSCGNAQAGSATHNRLNAYRANAAASSFVENGTITPTDFISGNMNRCFYHAVSYALYHNIDHWAEIRNTTWHYVWLLDNETDLLNLGVKSIEELATKYPDGKSTDIMFAKPLAYAIKMNIAVFAQESGWMYIFDKNGTYKAYESKAGGVKPEDVCCNTIKLYFNNGHYELFEYNLRS
jgi:hypothetical protein